MSTQAIEEFIQDELIRTALDPFDLASDLNMTNLPDNLNKILQKLLIRLKEVFDQGKRKMT
jgi:hypothetical protein